MLTARNRSPRRRIAGSPLHPTQQAEAESDGQTSDKLQTGVFLMPSQAGKGGGGGSALPTKSASPEVGKQAGRNMEIARPDSPPQECHALTVLEGLEVGGFVTSNVGSAAGGH